MSLPRDSLTIKIERVLPDGTRYGVAQIIHQPTAFNSLGDYALHRFEDLMQELAIATGDDL